MVAAAAWALAGPPAAARDEGAASAAAGEAKPPAPMTLIVSLDDQQLHVYRGLQEVLTSRVSSGKRGYDTPAGIYSILQKSRWHRSNIYSGAPMPFMHRITWSGIALHASNSVPNHPASHGCVRMPGKSAKELFGISDVGAHVVVAHGMPSPEPIEHAALIQPAPPPLLTAGGDALRPEAALDAVRVASFAGVVSPAAPATSGSAMKDRPVALYLADFEQSMAGGAVEDDDDATLEAQADTVEPTVAASTDSTETEEAAPRPVALYLADLETDLVRQTEYAERSEAPLRILVTRRTGRERTMDVQRLLAALGHDPGEIDGYMGPATSDAIQSFQTAHGMTPSGTFTEELVEAVYRVAGKSQPTGHIYVRQKYKDVFDAPVVLKDPDQPLGTHIFTAMDFAKGETRAQWLVIDVEGAEAGSSAAEALERVVLDRDIRDHLAAMLTPGSSLIISDSGLGRETGKGTDFIVQF